MPSLRVKIWALRMLIPVALKEPVIFAEEAGAVPGAYLAGSVAAVGLVVQERTVRGLYPPRPIDGA